MSSRTLAQLQRLEIALRPGFNQRASLQSASSFAWEDCGNSAKAAHEMVDLLISAHQDGSAAYAALWLHWRKSSASKQFLALLRAVSEAIASAADWMPAVAASAASAAAGRVRLLICMENTRVRAMSTLRLLCKGTHDGALWPALRDWLADSLPGLWGNLAWCSGGTGDAAAILVVQDLVSMTHAHYLRQGPRPAALLQHPRVAEAMGQALSTVLPQCFARGEGQQALHTRLMLLRVADMALSEPQLGQRLHFPTLSLWPYLVGALRRLHEAGEASYSFQECVPVLLSMLKPLHSHAAYLARLWACAIDVVEMVAMLGQSEDGGVGWRWDRKALECTEQLIPSLDKAYSPTVATDSPTLRQAWGLTVRSEQALRAAAPHWGSLEAAGGWFDLADSICLTTSSLLVERQEPSEAWNAECTAISLLQLLTSNTATMLKVARHSILMDETLLHIGMSCFHDITLRCSVLGPACPQAINTVGPTVFFLLAPRHTAYASHAAPSWAAKPASGVIMYMGFWLHWMVTSCCSLVTSPRLSPLALAAQPMTALLPLVMEEVKNSPMWNTLEATNNTITALSNYAEAVAERAHQLASCGCEGAAAGSDKLRDLLAQPVLCLLGSPLLDQLAMLQHAPNENVGQYVWPDQYCPSFAPPLNRSDEADIVTHQGRRHLSVTLHVLLDAMLHLLEASSKEESGSQVPGHGVTDTYGGGCWWWGFLGSTREESLLGLTRCLQTMWDMGGCSLHRLPDTEVDFALPAKARSYSSMPSQMDVPSQAEALARDSAAAVLGAIRKLAGLVWPADHPARGRAVGSGSLSGRAAAYADWEVLQAEVLMPLPESSERPQLPGIFSSAAATAALALSEGPQLPAASSLYSGCCWGEGLWCFNPACTNLSGPSELAMQTSACGGGCGVRYCSPECQAQGWRDGHRLSCARLRARMEALALTQM